METLHTLIIFLSALALSAAVGDVCICNRAGNLRPVFDMNYMKVGVLSPGDCKIQVRQSNIDAGWFAIQFNEEVGFVKQQGDIVIDQCIDIQYEGFNETTVATKIPVTYTVPPQLANNTVITNITYITNITNIVNTNNTNGNTTHVHGNITLSHALLGNPKHCPPYVIQGAHTNGYVLTQHGHACYEINTDMSSWTHAQYLCQERGGHLVTIHNDQENTYLQQLLSHTYQHKVWIGLNDKVHEEHFHWITGEKLTYTHWKPHHRKSSDHNHEDCVIMFSNGNWDDVACGTHTNGTKMAFICEYVVHNSAHIVG